MNLEDVINTSSAGGGIILTIIAGMIIVLPILIIIAIFTISSNSTKLTKQMDLLNKQMDYLLQIKEYEINNMNGWKPQKPNEIDINEKK